MGNSSEGTNHAAGVEGDAEPHQNRCISDVDDVNFGERDWSVIFDGGGADIGQIGPFGSDADQEAEVIGRLNRRLEDLKSVERESLPSVLTTDEILPIRSEGGPEHLVLWAEDAFCFALLIVEEVVGEFRVDDFGGFVARVSHGTNFESSPSSGTIDGTERSPSRFRKIDTRPELDAHVNGICILLMMIVLDNLEGLAVLFGFGNLATDDGVAENGSAFESLSDRRWKVRRSLIGGSARDETGLKVHGPVLAVEDDGGGSRCRIVGIVAPFPLFIANDFSRVGDGRIEHALQLSLIRLKLI